MTWWAEAPNGRRDREDIMIGILDPGTGRLDSLALSSCSLAACSSYQTRIPSYAENLMLSDCLFIIVFSSVIVKLSSC